MNPVGQKWKGIGQIVIGLIAAGLSSIMLIIVKEQNKFLLTAVYTLAGGIFASWIFNLGLQNFLKSREFIDAKDKLDVFSLLMFVNTKEGLIHSYSKPTNEMLNSIRYLLNLKLIRSVIFPETFHNGYRLTDIGRYILDKELRFKELYPGIFCDMHYIVFFTGQQYKKEFIKETEMFKRKYFITWEKCCDILKKKLKENGVLVNGDICFMFENYSKGKDFSKIMEEIIVPWKEQVDKERRFKSLRLYLSSRIIPFWISF